MDNKFYFSPFNKLVFITSFFLSSVTYDAIFLVSESSSNSFHWRWDRQILPKGNVKQEIRELESLPPTDPLTPCPHHPRSQQGHCPCSKLLQLSHSRSRQCPDSLGISHRCYWYFCCHNFIKPVLSSVSSFLIADFRRKIRSPSKLDSLTRNTLLDTHNYMSSATSDLGCLDSNSHFLSDVLLSCH